MSKSAAAITLLAATMALQLGCQAEQRNPHPQGYYQQGAQGQYPQANPTAQPQPTQPAVPVQPTQSATGAIPFQSLQQALPTAAPGWLQHGQVEGQTAVEMGLAVSSASCGLAQGATTARVTILDNAMAAGMSSMTINMAIPVDTTEERILKQVIQGHPAKVRFDKQRNTAQALIVVRDRLQITVEVSNTTGEAPATALAQQVNFAHLAALMGG
jgi:hypothetical protein